MSLEIVAVGALPPHRGGSAFALRRVLNILAEAGHRVRAIGPATPETVDHEAAFAAFCPGVEASWFEMPQSDLDPFTPTSVDYYARQTREVHRLLGERVADRRPDLIIVGRGSFIWGVPDFARRNGIPCLLMLHGLVLSLLRGDYPADEAARLLAEQRQADLVAVCAEHMAEALTGGGFHAPVVIPNAADAEHFRPGPRRPDLAARFNLAAGHVVALHVSNLKPIKRIGDLLDAAAGALEREPRLRVLIVGDGPLYGELQHRIDRQGLGEQVHMAGWVDHGELADYLRLGDFMVLPSASEGLPQAGLEAMACSRFVIGSDIPALRELIADDVDGLRFPMGDVTALTRQMLRVAVDPALRRRLGDAARSKVVDNYALPRAARGWLELVERLAAPR